jgi:hypothetical protein
MKKIKKLRFPSISFKPSKTLITFVLVVVAIFILGGGVYNIMEIPISVLPTPSNPVWYFQGMTAQTLNESLIFILFLIIGISGGYLAFRSTRRAYRPREARLFLAIGVAMMVVAFIGSEVILTWKGL